MTSAERSLDGNGEQSSRDRFLYPGDGDPNQVGHQTSICWIARRKRTSQKIELKSTHQPRNSKLR